MEFTSPNRLEILTRQNKGKTEFPYYLSELSHRLKTNVGAEVVLSLEETDRLFSVLKAGVARSNNELDSPARAVWRYVDVKQWSRCSTCLGEKLGKQAAVLFVGPFEFCGAVLLEAQTALTNARALLEFDTDTVSLQSRDSEAGLYLDLFEEGSDQMIELVAWGGWKGAALECASKWEKRGTA